MKRGLLIVFLMLNVTTNVALAASSMSSMGQQQLAQQLNRIIQQVSPNADVGVQIKSMQSGNVLYARNAQDVFAPASILKILTAEAALLYLGPQYTFSTRLMTDSHRTANGVIEGNVYLVHSGDPSLTNGDLSDLLEQLKAQHVHEVTGNIYIDNTAYDQSNFGPGWIWHDEQYCYGAPINASIIDHNCQLSRPAATTRRQRRANKVQYALGSSAVIRDVISYNKSLLNWSLRHADIQVDGEIQAGSAPSNARMLVEHQSQPLSALVKRMLKKSDNIIAGSLFKKMGAVYSKRPGSWANGSEAVKAVLGDSAEMSSLQMNLLDGSGLSPDNRIKPAQVMQVLNFAFHHSSTHYEFLTSLPIAGVDGTLKHRLYNVARRVRAKTGSMPISGVASLAGYAMSREKEPLAFVIIVNGHRGGTWKYRKMEDDIVTALANYRNA